MRTMFAVIAERFSDLTYRASVLRIEKGRNVYHDCIYNGDMISLTMCESCKEAQEIADCWNETWKNDGKLASFQTLSVGRRSRA